MSTYRVGHHQPQNVYRGEQYIGVMFTAEDAALVVEALNEVERVHGPARPIVVGHPGAAPCSLHTGWADKDGRWIECSPDCLGNQVGDSCTCGTTRDGRGVDPACPVHQGRRARGPKPSPVGTDEHHYDVSCDDRPFCRISEHHVAGVLP